MLKIYSITGEETDDRSVIPVSVVDGVIRIADNFGANSPTGVFATRVGVSLAPDQSVETLEHLLPRLGLVVLNFPTFADGRAFSQARLLRNRYAYAGDLRATGEVVQDQLAFMLSCGFNQFELSTPQESLNFTSALAEARKFANFLAGTALDSASLERRMSI